MFFPGRGYYLPERCAWTEYYENKIGVRGTAVGMPLSQWLQSDVYKLLTLGEPEQLDRLIDVLRNNLGLTSVKEGCSEGECGACTVIYNGEPVTSCCILAGQAEGADIITLEGISKDGQPDVVQQAFMDAGAVQCGFCIPGMILTAEAFLKKNPNPTRDEVKLAISGNLCRCTGYAKINDAVLLAAARMRGEEA